MSVCVCMSMFVCAHACMSAMQPCISTCILFTIHNIHSYLHQDLAEVAFDLFTLFSLFYLITPDILFQNIAVWLKVLECFFVS